MRTKKRILSMLLTVCLIVGMLPQTAFATEGATIGTSGLCEHHAAHDETCGYVEGIAETPCAHTHTEDCYVITESCTHIHTEDCYPVMDSGVSGNEATPSDAAEPICGHECSEESGCITKKLNCTHTEHDSECGYIAAVEGHDCHNECAECAAPVCTCETDDPAIHATNCPAYVAPENPACFCAEKCTEDNINVWCDVCGVQGIESCKGEDTAAVYAPDELYVGGTQVTTSGTASGSGWSYAEGTLTLTNANLTAGTNAITDAAIYFKNGDLTINIPTGTTSTINCGTDGEGAIYGAGTTVTSGTLKITGGGTLKITNQLTSGQTARAIFSSYYDVTIDGVTVQIESVDYAIDSKSLTITNSAVVSASSTNKYAISSSQGITINGGSKVYACGSSSGYAALTTAYDKTITVGGDNTVLYAGYTLDDNGLPTATIGSKYAVNNNNDVSFNMTGGTVYLGGTSGIVSSGSTINQTGGLLSQQTGNDGKTITVSGSHTLTDNLTIASNDTLTINEGATLTIPAGKTLENSGTLTNNGTVMNNGTVTNNNTGTCSTTAAHCYGTNDKCIICGAANLPALSTPANLSWDSTTPGKATWGEVTNATGYSVQLYKGDAAQGSPVSVTGTTHTFFITEAGSYTFTVKAIGDSTANGDSAESEKSGNLDFYAVSFDTDDGSAVDTQIVVSGGKAERPTDPTKAGHELENWYSDSALNTVFNFDSAINAETTIYAKWNAATYDVALNTNGGTINSGNVTSYTYGTGATLPTDVTKTNYNFGGWYADSGFSGSAVTEISNTDTGAKTYYAKWISKDAGITEVSVSGTAGTISGTTISVVLPYGSTIPTDSNAVSITPATGASASTPATTNSGATWTFTVTAEDGQTTANYTINVTIAENPAAGNIADIAGAKSTIESHNWTVAQATANTEADVKTWIETQLAAMNLNGASYTVAMTGFTAATTGSASDHDGTNGSFGFTVTLSKGNNTGNTATSTYATDTAPVTGGVITATGYSHTHVWSSTDWGTNSTHHWRECTAGDCTLTQGSPDSSKGSYGTHVWDNACDTDCNTCGYTRTITHSYGTVWNKDASGHWYECSVCGDKKDSAAHTPGAAATEDTPQTCTVCEYVITPALGHEHNYSTSLTYDSTGHWYACTCSEKKDFAAHSFDNACDTDCNGGCGYTRTTTHSYGSEWSKDASGHWYECSVCRDKKDSAEHTPGAAATETTAQTCTVCGYEIAPALGHTHSYGAWQSNSNGTHTRTCSGNSDHKETVSCSGGTATCKDKATCSVCGTSYGSTNSSNHTGGTEVQGKVDATATTAGYTGDTYCLGCNTKIKTGTTIPATGSGGGGTGGGSTGGNTGGGDSGNDDSGDDNGNDTPADTPATPVTVPVSGDENTIQVGASVSGTTATIDNVDLSALNTVIGDDVKTGVVTIDFSVLNVEVDTVEIPADVVKQIAAAVNDPNNDAESLEIVLSDGTSIEFDAKALGEKSAQAGGIDITISIKHTTDSTLNNRQQQTIGNRPALDINVTSGGKYLSDMGGKVTVHAPYELRPGEKADGIVVFYVDAGGNRERCETSYDSAKKRVNWKTDHLSVYMIGYEEPQTNPDTGGDTSEEIPKSPDTGDDTPAYVTYTVQRGDTLWAIAKKYGCTVSEIVAANSDLIKNPDLIYAGWQLKIPQAGATGTDNTPDAILPDDKKTTVYIVKRGDTLWAISIKYGCTVAEIVALNGELITDPDLIFAGWELKIPQD